MYSDEGSHIRRYKDELRAFCYWMTASFQEAETTVEGVLSRSLQETPGGPERERSRLLRLAASSLMDEVEERPPRTLPSLAAPPADPSQPAVPSTGEPCWVEPFPDDLVPVLPPGARARYCPRESVSLYFLSALQSLTVPQRAALVLCDVMGMGLEEASPVLRFDAASSGKALEEARSGMEELYLEEPGRREPPEETEGPALLLRYLHAWETADTGRLAERLAEDAVFMNPPSPSWYSGREAVRLHLASFVLGEGTRGTWRLLPRRASGQLASGVYRMDEERRRFRAHSLQVIYFDDGLVSELISFESPALFPLFDLLPELVVQG